MSYSSQASKVASPTSSTDLEVEKSIEATAQAQRSSIPRDSSIPPVGSSVDPEKAETTTTADDKVIDWDNPENKDNPLHWSKARRWWHSVPPALICFAATLASSIYTPSYPDVQRDFGVSTTVALLPLSLYVLALGCGPVIAAPLSETFGRKMVYIVSPPLGILFTLGAAFSPTFAGLVILRFFAGMSFSPSLAVGAGTNADCNPPHERATVTAVYILSPFLGPALGPVVGSFIATAKGWKWVQYTIIFVAILCWIPAFLTSETHKPIILARRRKSLGLPPPPSPFPNAKSKIKFLITVTLLRPVHMLYSEPIVAFLSLYIAFNFGVLFTFFAAFPYVFGTVYGFSRNESGLVFLAIGVGCVLAIPTCVFCDRRFYMREFNRLVDAGKTGIVAPEFRLYSALMGSFGLPIGLFWFAWTARPSIHWISPVLAAIPFAWGNLTIFISAGMYLIDTYQALNGASAMAANGLLRYVLGAAFPLFALQMYQALGIGWATSLLAFVTVGLLPIPWILFKFGKRIRAKSHYDTIKEESL